MNMRTVLTVSAIALSILLIPGLEAYAKSPSNELLAVSNSGEGLARSTKTHAVPDNFDKLQDSERGDEEKSKEKSKELSATEVVKRTAEEQLQNSPKSAPDETIVPRTAGRVYATTQARMQVVNEATKIEEHSSDAAPALPTKEELKRPTIALALGGGGARGAAHIGVIRVLEQAGIPIDYVVGNSMGAIVGGLYCAGVPLEKITGIMEDGSLRKAYLGKIPPKILISPLEKLANPRSKHYAGLFSGKKYGQFLEKILPPDVKNVQDTKIPFSAVALNLLDGKAYRIDDGDLSTAIRASSSISPLLQPVAIGDKVYVDGGVRANLPASAAKDTGANIVIAVLVDEPLRRMPPDHFRHLTGVANRLTDVVLAISDERQLQFADIVINPDCSGIPVIANHPEDAQKAIKAGEDAARKALPEIKKRLGRFFDNGAIVASQKNVPPMAPTN
jgi:predicted acylesterase/phospholipase RssA